MLEFVLGYAAAQQGAGRSASFARSASVGDATIHSNRIEDLNERIDSLAKIMRAMWASSKRAVSPPNSWWPSWKSWTGSMRRDRVA